jgi:hypothetical protein
MLTMTDAHPDLSAEALMRLSGELVLAADDTVHMDADMAVLAAARVLHAIARRETMVAARREQVAAIIAEDDDFVGVGPDAFAKADRIIAALLAPEVLS